MRRIFAALPCIAILLTTPAQIAAKGDTVRITITGEDLATPIEIVELGVVARFNVWTSPVNADLSRGAVVRPEHLQVYEVSFVTTRTNPSSYVVHYAINPETDEGFVYLPGKADPEYRSNTWLIYRGVEGNWFHSRSEWETLARPLIERAKQRAGR